MRYLVPIVIYLSLFLVTGYFLLRFFSSLAGVDMFAAMAWGFKAKRFELVLPLVMFYLIAFVMVFAIVLGLFSTSTASFTHKGGLLGYKSADSQYQYFEPVLRRYEAITHYGPPPAAQKLNETFTLVSFYKPLFTPYYHNLTDLSLVVSIIKIIFSLLGIIPLYLVLFALAVEFGSHTKTIPALTHAMIAKQFQINTGFGVMTMISVAVLAILIITVVEHQMEQRITRDHREVLGHYAEEYQKLVTRQAAPGKKILGRIIRRDDTVVHKLYSRQTQSRSDVNKKEYRTVPVKIYTVEFRDLIQIPVYIGLQLTGDAASNPEIRKIDALFDGSKSSQPTSDRALEFTVNQDYTLALTDPELRP